MIDDPALKMSTKDFLKDFLEFKQDWEKEVNNLNLFVYFELTFQMSCNASTTTADTKPKVIKKKKPQDV